MKLRTAFTKKDLAIVLACIIFLLINFGAIGNSGRRNAKDMVCLSNLNQWGHFFSAYTQANDGKFMTGERYTGYWWPWQLEEPYKDWKQNKTWFCPTATTPIVDEKGNVALTLNIFTAWGIYKEIQVGHSSGSNGIAGSYGLNGHVLATNNPSPRGTLYMSTVDNWMTPNVAGASNIPLFIDALRFDLWPWDGDMPASDEYSVWTSTGHMARCCINRHNGAVNCLFLDFSARKVGLKELWTLTWYRSFNIANPWTLVGGVLPSDWPEWMRNFKDY
jgi:prepilin-type processing-associated H-X9-DG protein